MVVGTVSLAALIVIGRFGKRLPAALIVVVAGIAASWALDLSSHGVKITGPVPSGLPSLTVPDVSWSDVGRLVTGALAIFLVGFSDSILTARSFAARHHEVVDADQELLAFGFANVAAGFTQSMPVAASGSRTAVNDDMGATSQVSGLAAAATIAVILVFLTGPIQYLPSAVLGAVIVFAAAKLIDVDQWRSLAVQQQGRGRHRRDHDPVRDHRRRAASHRRRRGALRRRCRAPGRPPRRCRARMVGRRATGTSTSSISPTPASPAGVVVYRIQDRMFFANAHFFKRRLWAAVDGAPKPVHHVVLDASSISDVDASAEVALREVIDGLRGRNIESPGRAGHR